MTTQRIAGGWLLAAALTAAWVFSTPALAAGPGNTITVQGQSTGSANGPKKPGPGVLGPDGRVLPPPRPSVITHVSPGVPHEDLKEADHERGTKFNAGKFRAANGKVFRN